MEEIVVIALLRLGGRFTAKGAKAMFEASYLNDLYPDVALSQNTVGAFMARLGERRDEMVRFMRFYIKKGQQLIFDGTNIFTSCSDTWAKRGYNSAGNKKRAQIRLIYVFDAEGHSPAFYRLVPGNIVDKSSLELTVAESGARQVLVIGDKGFYSKINVSFLMRLGLSFILRAGRSKYLGPALRGTGRDRFDGVFIYTAGRSGTEGEPGRGGQLSVHLHGRGPQEETRCLEKMEDDWEDLDMDGFLAEGRRGLRLRQQPGRGPKRVFLDYKGRWDVEQCFDYLKNVVAPGPLPGLQRSWRPGPQPCEPALFLRQ